METQASPDRPLTVLDLAHPLLQDRRGFMKTAALAVAALAWLDGGPEAEAAGGSEKPIRYGMILVDFNKCTGCRTCETVCAQYNHKMTIDGRQVPGLGNPARSNIRVYPFNPDADVPIVCVMCSDAPCIAACPVDPDSAGRRALFRDPQTQAIRNDPQRCLACGACAEACREKRVGAIEPDRETGRPEGMCTLCGGDPQCVRYCPYEALTYVVGGLDGRHYGLGPEKIAQGLIERWYGPRGRKEASK